MRFERTVDRSGCAAAADRAAALLAEIAGGEVGTGIVDVYPHPHAPRSLTLRAERLEQVLGTRITMEEADAILVRLGCKTEMHADRIELEVPSFRPDLEREIDLVEEVLRVWGMERIPASLPAGRGRVGGLTPQQAWRDRVGVTLRAAGLNETMTYAFGDPGDLDRLNMPLGEGEMLVHLLNPMSAEQAVLRRTLLPGLLRSVSYNQRRGVSDVHLYELGTAYWTAEGRKQPKERAVIAGVLAGSWHPAQWNDPAVPLDFFDGKGVLETLVRELGIARFKLRKSDLSWLQPGRSAEVLIGGEVLGWLGEIHPAVLERFECVPAVTAFEIDLGRLIRAASDARSVVEPPRYPAMELDLAIVVSEDVTAERIEQAIRAAGGKLLEGVRLFDVYRGANIGDGKKSMAFALTYRVPDRTLTTDEVESAHEKLVRKVLGATGGELRS